MRRRGPRTPAQRAGGIDGQIQGWNDSGRGANDAFMLRRELVEADRKEYANAYYEAYERTRQLKGVAS